MRRARLVLLQLLVAVAILLLWYVAGTTTLFGDPQTVRFFFSTPFEVTARIVEWFASGSIWYHLWITLLESVLAFVIGAGGGVVVGFAFARRPLLAAVLDPYVRAANALPRVVLAPSQTDPGIGRVAAHDGGLGSSQQPA